MRRPLLALAAVLFSGVAVPALAAWDRIGSVDFTFRNNRDTQYGNFGGSVEALALRARDATVTCRNVSATFGDGQVRSIFTGTLPRGQDVTVDLPGRDRMIRRLDFDCRSAAPRGATVDISADVGRYRAEWRRSPDWNRMWARMFNWGPDVADNTPDRSRDYARGDNRFGDNGRFGDNRGDNRFGDNRDNGRGRDNGNRGWRDLGTASFEGFNDRETALPGWRGRRIDTIGLKAVNDDARCREVVVNFANGETRTIATGTRLTEDRITQIDLPGDQRNVTGVSMNCRAEHGRQVAIQVLGRDPDGRLGFNR